MASASTPIPTNHHVPLTVKTDDIRREKRLLLKAIAATRGQHRIRLQRELAALEAYERGQYKRYQEHSVFT
ncbi:MAG: hypothetical protein ACFFCO_02120 [Promethearchaeota archaeon]